MNDDGTSDELDGGRCEPVPCELLRFETCNLFNSGHQYRDGYGRAVCSCGWHSVPARGHEALARLFEVHAFSRAAMLPCNPLPPPMKQLEGLAEDVQIHALLEKLDLIGGGVAELSVLIREMRAEIETATERCSAILALIAAMATATPASKAEG